MSAESIASLRARTLQEAASGVTHVQAQSVTPRTTREGKPYIELTLADATDRLTLRVWSDHPHFKFCSEIAAGSFFEMKGEFQTNGTYGMDSRRWTLEPLVPEEIEALLAGPIELRTKQTDDFSFIEQTVSALSDPRLRALAQLFLEEYGPRFRRTAAARNYHHARRGGLVEHTAQMMRAANAIADVYPKLNRDLLLTGVLFHDCGKLWENSMEEEGFTMPHQEMGEMLGHITVGIEVVNALWRKLATRDAEGEPLQPASESVRLHLLHLIAAHHGELEFGSPVVPKTPEAHALHYIDNLDAKLEMLSAGYRTAIPLAPNIFERVRPLPGNLVRPLDPYRQA